MIWEEPIFSLVSWGCFFILLAVVRLCWRIRWLFGITWLTGYVRRVVKDCWEFSVKYMLLLGKYLMLNIMMIAKRYYDDEGIRWCTGICKVVWFPSDERYMRYMTADNIYNWMLNIITGGIWS